MGTLSEKALREAVGNFLWVMVSLLLLVLSNSDLTRAHPLLSSYTPLTIFLTFLGLQISLWESLGLSLGSPLNPAVSVSLCLSGATSLSTLIISVPAQFIGTVGGVYAARILSGVHFVHTLRVFAPPAPSDMLSTYGAMLFEALLTALMCIATLSMKRLIPAATVLQTAVMIGVIVTLIAQGADHTGSCMNPAMAFALSLAEHHWEHHFVYCLGPLLGAIGAALVHNVCFGKLRENNECVNGMQIQIQSGLCAVRDDSNGVVREKGD